MAATGRNEDFRLLDDFTCEAISAPGASQLDHMGRGKNPGMDVLTEVISRASQSLVTSERIAELRRLSSDELLILVKDCGSELDRQELLVIHDIAVERLDKGESPFFEVSRELSREVMHAAVSRSA
jgi:hypothetical protein